MMYSKLSDDAIAVIIADFSSKDCEPSHLQSLFSDLCYTNCHHKYIKILSMYENIEPCINRVFLTASCIGHIEVLKILLDSKKVDLDYDNDYAIKKASSNGHTEIVRILLEHSDKINPATNANYSIRKASSNGHTEIVKMLLQCDNVDPADSDNGKYLDSLSAASIGGHIEIVKMLLECNKPNIHKIYYIAINNSFVGGHIETIKLLLMQKKYDPIIDDNNAICVASRRGYVQIVKLLLTIQGVDPSVNNNYAIKTAFKNRHLRVVKQLLKSKKINLKNIDDSNILELADQLQSQNKTSYVKKMVSLMKLSNISKITIDAKGLVDITRIFLITNIQDNPQSHTKLVNMMTKYNVMQVDISNTNMFVFGDIN